MDEEQKLNVSTVENYEENANEDIIENTYVENDEDIEDQVDYTNDKVDALIRLLIKKNLITEEEIEKEYSDLYDEEYDDSESCESCEICTCNEEESKNE